MARELAIENGKLKSNLDANGNKVANLATPTSDGDAATKKYVDERPTPPPSWSDITNKPTEFPPKAHTHTKSEITDFPTSMPPTAHSHASDSWFTSAIEAVKSWASGAFAAIKHSHAGDSWFTTALDGKVGSFTAVGGVTPTVSGGVADVAALFSTANSQLVNLIRNNSAQLALDDQGEIVVTMHTED